MESTTKKTALITGATSGIGRELANLFAKDGYNLVLVGRQEDNLLDLVETYEQQFGINVTPIAKDLSDPKAAEEIYAETQHEGQTINVLVNDAGFGEYGMFATETDLKREMDMIQVNIGALVQLTKLYLKDMVQRNEGKILMLGSIASVIPNPLMAVYGATKSFIYSFSEALRNELKDTNVTVTVLMPGATNTNFFNTAGAAHVKGADPSKTADPADVAKDGYEALMAGKDKVVSGLKNKATIASAYVLPDGVVAAQARSDMEPKDESQQQQTALAISIGVAALVVGGLLLAYRNTNALERAEYRYKANKLGRKAKMKAMSVGDTIASVADQSVGKTLTSVAKKAKAGLEDVLA